MDKLQKKREEEIKAVTEMIGIFCQDVHKTDGVELCPECEELLEYIKKRVNSCPRMAEKTLCSECRTHCYAPNRQQRIKQIMHYSGSKLALRSPVMAVRRKITHWISTIQQIVYDIF